MQVVYEGVLWKYHQLKNKEYTVKVRMTNYRIVEYINTKLSCLVENWDDKKGEPRLSHPQFLELSKKLNQIKDDIKSELKLAEKNAETLSMEILKLRVEDKGPNNIVQEPRKKILQFYDEIIKEMENEGRTGSADIFSFNKSFISKNLLNGRDRNFADINEQDFQKLEHSINMLNTESTKSLYLRSFYRVWNIAIKRKHCSDKHHPKFYIHFKVYKRIKTKKRAIPLENIHKIEALKFGYDTRLFRSLQYFIFSYYCRGINFTDFAQLKWGIHIDRGFIHYKRSKNKRIYDFELHPKALHIVELFKDYPMQSDNNYVFPILDSIHDTPRKIATRIDSALKDFNEDLVEFEKKTDCPKHITSYVIRHAFATNLRDKNVSVSIIKEALGHETEFQTNTYLQEMDDSVVAQIIKEALQ